MPTTSPVEICKETSRSAKMCSAVVALTPDGAVRLNVAEAASARESLNVLYVNMPPAVEPRRYRLLSRSTTMTGETVVKDSDEVRETVFHALEEKQPAQQDDE